ncbi:MAG: NAD(P)H-hydrate dehydratase [Opitutaceae bacterium]
MPNADHIPGALPVLSCAEARELEQRLLGGGEAREWAAMRRAGCGIGRAVTEDAREIGGIAAHGSLLVLCGKGHNGGDALLAAHQILDAHPAATALVVIVPGFAALRPLVRRALEALCAMHRRRVECVSVNGPAEGRDAARLRKRLGGARFDLCLDGLFGMQFRPPFRAPADWLIELVNDHPAIRLRAAVDVPSGVGDASAEAPFRADFTYAAGVAKRPLFASPNSGYAGRVRLIDIGFFESETEHAATRLRILTARVLEPWAALRAPVSDKRKFGHLFVVSGARDMAGAVLMTVEAALLSGVGLVTAFVPESIAASAAARLPEAMWVPMPETPGGGLALEGRGAVVARSTRCTALLTGPGLGRDRETHALVRELLKSIDVPAVVDGDALQPDVIGVRKPLESGTVLTPHAGEFARVSGADDAGDDALRKAARDLDAVVVLKGTPTRICKTDTVYVSPFGGPVLARGGSGDFLAGLIGGLVATGMPPLHAALRGAVWHGLAADALARASGQASARVTRLADHLGQVLREEEVDRG